MSEKIEHKQMKSFWNDNNESVSWLFFFQTKFLAVFDKKCKIEIKIKKKRQTETNIETEKDKKKQWCVMTAFFYRFCKNIHLSHWKSKKN